MLAGLLFSALAGAPLFAQDREPQKTEPDVQVPREHTAEDYEEPPHALEFALGGDGLWFTYRTGLHRGKGYEAVSLFLGAEDDVALQAQLMRYGEPRADVPLGVGVGIGLFGAEVDESNDEVYAITLTGGMDYALDRLFGFTYPTRIGAEVSWAPDLATFGDGQRVLDFLARVEADLSTWATAFVGYRHLEVDLSNA